MNALIRSCATLVLVALLAPALAAGANADPPTLVARLSDVQGTVGFQAAGAASSQQAVINLPVTTGDQVITSGAASRAELTLGTAAIRLDGNTRLSVSDLDADIVQLQVEAGAVSIHVRELTTGDTFEVDTPDCTALLLEAGDYRVNVAPAGGVVVEVRNGEAQVNSGSGPVQVHAQQQARISASDHFPQLTSLGAPDAFDEWSMQRERDIHGDRTPRYVSPQVVGYEALDAYGTWEAQPGYGEVWIPDDVGVDWAPYRFGSWIWVAPWGWTWLDDEPWGFAPFHYGRWAYLTHRHRWCWVPGPRHRHAVYAPALVAWVGFAQRHGTHHPPRSRHQRPVHWLALGPHDVYIPSHHVSPRYLRNVNVSNTTIASNAYLTNVYRHRIKDIRYANRRAPGALGSMPAGAFRAGQPAQRYARALRAHPSASVRARRDARLRALLDGPSVSPPALRHGPGHFAGPGVGHAHANRHPAHHVAAPGTARPLNPGASRYRGRYRAHGTPPPRRALATPGARHPVYHASPHPIHHAAPHPVYRPSPHPVHSARPSRDPPQHRARALHPHLHRAPAPRAHVAAPRHFGAPSRPHVAAPRHFSAPARPHVAAPHATHIRPHAAPARPHGAAGRIRGARR